MRDALARYRMPVTVAVIVALVWSVSAVWFAPVALADSCGSQPDWWTPAYISWLSCEISSGGATASITQVVSPIFNDISDAAGSIQTAIWQEVNYQFPAVITGVNNVKDAINSLSSGISGIVSGMTTWLTTFFLPSPDDMAPLTDYFGTLTTTGPLSFVGHVITAYQSFSSTLSYSSASHLGSTASPATWQTTITTSTGERLTIGDFGPMAGGVDMFFSTLAANGLSRATWFDITDAIWALLLVSSILSDLGVRVGDLGATATAWTNATDFEGRDHAKAWRNYSRSQQRQTMAGVPRNKRVK